MSRALQAALFGLALGMLLVAIHAYGGQPASQTIAEIKRAHPESLWSWIFNVPSTIEAQIFAALTIGSMLGMAGHYFRQWASGDIAGSLNEYLFTTYPRRTALAIFGAVTWSAGEVGSGLFITDTGEFVGWALILISGIKTGYLGDSLANRGARPATPTGEAAAATTPPQGAKP